MKTLRAKRRAAARWCEENGIEPGMKIEILGPWGWFAATVTAIGQSAILARHRRHAETIEHEPTKLRVVTTGLE
jgi:hypothetical protein